MRFRLFGRQQAAAAAVAAAAAAAAAAVGVEAQHVKYNKIDWHASMFRRAVAVNG